jgi:2,4-dienoyl-CoA reductase-like NADH-dependent reductase (Old Yellow Enzyme family)
MTEHLFSPLSIKSITLKNRIAVSPMCQYSSEQGFANDWHKIHLGSRAVGGAALVMTEATAVTPEGRISPQDLGIWSDEHIPALSDIVKFIEKENSIAGIQLAHAGRKASTARPWDPRKQISVEEGGWQPLAPSAIPFSKEDRAPKELSIEEIQTLIHDFAKAAERARKAGFKIIEIHSAHGYLLHEFLSPLSNTRNDQYGGSFDNRVRLLIEVVTAVKKKWPEELPLFIRISATDWVTGGWTIDESIKLCQLLKNAGADLIDVSSGGTVAHAKIPIGPGYQIPFAQQIRNQAKIATAAVGMITAAAQADQIIRTQQADMVFIAREILRNPYWPLLAAHELGHKVAWPPQYLRAAPQ